MALVMVLAAGFVAAIEAEAPLDLMLSRAATYVRLFRQQLSSVVAEETYKQTVRTAMGVTITVDGKGTQPTGHRALKSDILMVRTPDGYAEFRDVFEVDGRPVRDRQDRLADLFISGNRQSGDQILHLNQESSRYNIGNVYRNFNTPALALMFLEPEYQSRFSFRLSNNRTPALALAQERGTASPFSVSDRLIVVEYKETQKHTVIRRMDSLGDLPANGRFWLEPDSGAILLSELIIADPLMRCTIDVAFGTAAGINVLVPREMRERYLDNRDRVVTDGTATYDKLRRFQVDTQEVIPEIR